jgi:hypothetical protein
MNKEYDDVCAGITTIFKHYCGNPVHGTSNGELIFTCPICKKNKLGVNKNKRVANCFVCGGKWNAITLIQELDSLDKDGAIARGLSILGIESPPIVSPQDWSSAKRDDTVAYKQDMYLEIYSFLRGNLASSVAWSRDLFPSLNPYKRAFTDILVSDPSWDVVDRLRENWSLREISACPGFLTNKRTGRVKFCLSDHVIFTYWSPDRSSILAFNGRVKDEASSARRYRWLTGEHKHIYFPFGVTLDNATVITEGEKKAILAQAMGIHTIAVAGVNCFKVPEIPALKGHTKKLYVCYDREKENPNVRAAEQQLATYLARKLGIAAPIIELPYGYKLDDYLIEYGVDAFDELKVRADEHST